MIDVFETPIILVGAHRSGTKMLRELLKKHPDLTGELFEEERIWCTGHRDQMYGRIDPSELTGAIRTRIRKYFYRKAVKNRGKRIIDKNTNNSLRLDYVKAVFPESPVIHIIRDGRAASASLMVRWKKPLDWRYILREKAFPLKEVPFFLKRQIHYNWAKFFSGEKRANLYGIRFEGIEAMLEARSLIEVCGRQWLTCVKAALESAAGFGSDEYLEVRYEDLIRDPAGELKILCDFLKLKHADLLYKPARDYVRPNSLDKWKKELLAQDLKLLNREIGVMQKTLGYE